VGTVDSVRVKKKKKRQILGGKEVRGRGTAGKKPEAEEVPKKKKGGGSKGSNSRDSYVRARDEKREAELRKRTSRHRREGGADPLRNKGITSSNIWLAGRGRAGSTRTGGGAGAAKGGLDTTWDYDSLREKRGPQSSVGSSRSGASLSLNPTPGFIQERKGDQTFNRFNVCDGE